MDLSVLIVSFNTREKTLACLGSVARETSGLDYEILVLDNASGDGSAAAIRAAYPELALDVQPENLGFGRAINRLARAARGEFLLLLNPDTEVLDGALQKLVAFARAQPEPGISGGRSVRADGSADPDFAWARASVWSTLCNALGLAGLFPRSRLFHPEGIGARLGPGAHEVDIVSGCFFLVPRALWHELDGFDPAFFVYGEEADLCLRARARGIRARSTSSALVLHHGGASEASLASKQTKLLGAKRRLMSLHWSKGRARLGGWLLAVHAALRAGGYSLLAWLRPRRFDTRARGWREVWARRQEWLHPEVRRKRILAISSGGGHWLQLRRIQECFAGHDIAYATVHASARSEVARARFYELRDASRWNKFGLVVLAAQTFWIVLKERPDVLVTTGAAPGLLGIFFGKCLGARTLWIDSIANAEELSLSGRLAGRFADLWLTQWPHLERPGGPHFRGTVV